MSEDVLLPKWGLTMEEGTLKTWRKRVGEAVAEGEVLADVETDKVSTELPAPVAGILARILVQEEETVPVGTVLAVIAATAEEAAALRQ